LGRARAGGRVRRRQGSASFEAGAAAARGRPQQPPQARPHARGWPRGKAPGAAAPASRGDRPRGARHTLAAPPRAAPPRCSPSRSAASLRAARAGRGGRAQGRTRPNRHRAPPRRPTRSQRAPHPPPRPPLPPQSAPYAAAAAAASTLLAAGNAAAATEVAQLAGDARLGIIAALFLPAVGWVLFNIAGPAFNQIAAMGQKKAAAPPAKKGGKKRSVAGLGLGLTAASLLAASAADAATDVAQLAGDSRGGLLALLFAPALGWVAFNIAGPAFNQISNMQTGGPAAAAPKKGRR